MSKNVVQSVQFASVIEIHRGVKQNLMKQNSNITCMCNDTAEDVKDSRLTAVFE